MNQTDLEALRAFYVEFRQPLFTYAVSITADRAAAEDAIHAAFHHLLRRATLPAELRPYLFRCVRNAAIDARRRARRAADSLFAADVETAGETPGARLFDPDEVNCWLQQLSPDQRETLVLKLYDNFTFQEIAVLRDVPLPTVASWYRRGLEKLKAKFSTTLQ